MFVVVHRLVYRPVYVGRTAWQSYEEIEKMFQNLNALWISEEKKFPIERVIVCGEKLQRTLVNLHPMIERNSFSGWLLDKVRDASASVWLPGAESGGQTCGAEWISLETTRTILFLQS